VLPILYRDCEIPSLIADKRYADFRKSYEFGFSEVLKALTPPEFEPEMVLIPAGEFLMGSDPSVDKDAQDEEQPQHTLYLPDYYLAKTPVTNAQYAAFAQATYRQPSHWEGGKPPSGKEDHPVVNVTWHDAVAYCHWLSEVTGRPYRLPSEAEWEKGARGTDGRIYPWGNQWDAERCNSEESGKGDTTPVGAYPEGASPYGLLDMVGNVWEWTRSAVKSYPYDPDDGREDFVAERDRVLRGGSWFDVRVGARCVERNWDDPNTSDFDFGFRLVSPVLF
jgi:formylglycine-generating enzyme required for sulfatase activity